MGKFTDLEEPDSEDKSESRQRYVNTWLYNGWSSELLLKEIKKAKEQSKP